MSGIRSIAIVGATGMLGRPVARRLVREGFEVRAISRDAGAARALLPADCGIVEADPADESSVARAIEGSDAVYINLSTPRSPRQPNAEAICTPVIAAAAARAGVRRLLKISAMGVEEARDVWWAAEQKMQSDQVVIDSGVPYTIFRPTWFMESIALFLMGPRLMMRPGTPDAPLYWLAGDDYARQVVAALRSETSANRIYHNQGGEGVGFGDALRRFADARSPRPRILPFPRAMLNLMATFGSEGRYLADLLDMTFNWVVKYDAGLHHDELGAPSMTIEDYAGYVAETGDLPSK